ncbi:metal-dependent hydrolase family protein [Terribacillus saccharophilus]|uniref:Aryldialkylphosphatase n=1 Tax=Terribacillus saccharophilus TaxID=361277 RepID=A0ABX4GYV4_9BACI|nr:amidohydrolase family protein [Terribacillus saccharophilus]PAD35554.1 aryldialkylphosphatase [Terribacillus saccharophilus]PAD96485.1 aryldialkylphosphatase [Terribacillus saccharophilus]PAE00061.1 aryldialkylphosphatase [Terribacillus saccharophilus]
MDKLIRNGVVIDGTGKVIEDAVIAIKGDRITAIGPATDFVGIDAKEVIDAQGGYILPGLIDTHVHMMMEIKDVRESLITPFSMRFYEALAYMKRTLDAGITTVRDAGYADLGVKQAIENGLISGPRMQISVNPLTITGGHGDNWMVSDMDLTNKAYPGFPSGICDGPEQVRQKVREMLRAGADIIKVHATGGVMSPTDHPEFTQFSMEELRIIVEEAAYRKGRKVMAHAQGAEGVKQAVRAGIHSIEHGIFLDDEAIELMLEHGTYLVPTLLAPVSVVEASEANESMPAYAVDKAKEVMEIHQQSVARAYEAGVKIAMGTDAGVMAHGTNLRELALMCDIGMSPMEAILASTKIAAECLGWEERIGTIAEGKLADLVIVQDNPLENIASMADTNNIKTVMQGGELKKQLSIHAGIPS